MTSWGSAVFSDTFTEGSNTALGSHSPDTGTSWTVDHGGAQVNAANDDVEQTSGLPRATANVSGGVSADMAVEATISRDVNNNFTGVLFRYTSLSSAQDDFTAYAAFWNGNTVYLYERVGGTSWTLHGSASVTQGVSNTIRGEADDALSNNISLWTDTGSGLTKQVEVADSTLTSGEPGLRLAAASEELDNFAVYEKAGGGNPVLGIASETDTALAFNLVKSLALGTATQFDVALAIATSKALALNIATETDSPIAMNADKAQQLGVSAESDSAIAFTHSKSIPLGTALESDTAVPFGGFVQLIRTIRLHLGNRIGI